MLIICVLHAADIHRSETQPSHRILTAASLVTSPNPGVVINEKDPC
jgi:hypothetical protein